MSLSFLEDMLKNWIHMMRWNAAFLSCVKQVSLQNIGLKLSNLCFSSYCMYVLKGKEKLVYNGMSGNKWCLFFPAGYYNYARYGLHCINSMEKLPNETLESFMKWEHVTCHKRRIWKSIWSNMMIETTYIKFEKGPGRITGVKM